MDPIISFFKEQDSHEYFETLKSIDPKLMNQLLAREYVLKAKKVGSSESAKENLEKALELDPNCPEACFEMASLSDTPEKAMMWYQRCMDASTVMLGHQKLSKLLEDFKEAPWRQTETHFWMKAKVSLAEQLFSAGYHQIAILHFQDLLSLNASDDLGIRHFLIISFLCENRLHETNELLRRYRDDWSPTWIYSKAFLRFLEEGCTRKSKRILHRAFSRNLWVAIYLTGLEKMPPIHLKSMSEGREPFREGSQKEAVECVYRIAPCFCKYSELAYWVWEEMKTLAA